MRNPPNRSFRVSGRCHAAGSASFSAAAVRGPQARGRAPRAAGLSPWRGRPGCPPGHGRRRAPRRRCATCARHRAASGARAARVSSGAEASRPVNWSSAASTLAALTCHPPARASVVLVRCSWGSSSWAEPVDLGLAGASSASQAAAAVAGAPGHAASAARRAATSHHSQAGRPPSSASTGCRLPLTVGDGRAVGVSVGVGAWPSRSRGHRLGDHHGLRRAGGLWWAFRGVGRVGVSGGSVVGSSDGSGVGASGTMTLGLGGLRRDRRRRAGDRDRRDRQRPAEGVGRVMPPSPHPATRSTASPQAGASRPRRRSGPVGAGTGHREAFLSPVSPLVTPQSGGLVASGHHPNRMTAPLEPAQPAAT